MGWSDRSLLPRKEANRRRNEKMRDESLAGIGDGQGGGREKKKRKREKEKKILTIYNGIPATRPLPAVQTSRFCCLRTTSGLKKKSCLILLAFVLLISLQNSSMDSFCLFLFIYFVYLLVGLLTGRMVGWFVHFNFLFCLCVGCFVDWMVGWFVHLFPIIVFIRSTIYLLFVVFFICLLAYLFVCLFI